MSEEESDYMDDSEQELEFTVEYWNERLKGEVDTDFINRQIGDYGVKSLCESLKTNKDITGLILIDCGLSLTGGLQYLCKFLETNHTITSLNLSSNELCDEGIHDICEVLKKNQTITDLDLEDNDFLDSAVVDIYDMLKENQTLTHLDISHNGIDHYQMMLLLNALNENITLTQLQVYGNYTKECSEAIEMIDEKLKENILKRKKQRHDCGTILLFCRVLLETFNDLPLDIFKIIWKLSGVL